MHEDLEALGIGRMLDSQQAIVIHFNRPPTDEELSALHELLRYASDVLAPPGGV